MIHKKSESPVPPDLLQLLLPESLFADGAHGEPPLARYRM
jgi:hypothetical protein